MNDKSVLDKSTIANPSLAPDGYLAIAWVQRHTPVLNSLVRKKMSDGSLSGKRIAVVVHLEAKTAYLATILAEAGAHVVVAGSNPHSTRDDVTAALVDMGIEVHSSRNSGYEQWERDLLAVADTEPEFIIDDGAELTRRIEKHRPKIFKNIKGVSEETTTGVDRLRALEKAGKLPFPAIVANNAACKHMFDNRYGTGQSSVQAILRETNILMGGKKVAIVGYGWVGRGIAKFVRGLGGRVIVIEIDPIKALEAYMDGHEVLPVKEALPFADIVVTATGRVRSISSKHFSYLKPNVIMANAGHQDLEIDVEALGKESTTSEELREGVVCYDWHGKPVNVLNSGALVNISGGLGNPIEIMDLSFSVQGLSCHALINGNFPPGIHSLPKKLDDEIAHAKLASVGITLDSFNSDLNEISNGL
jgi:adenosylhomocysteinase